MSLLDELKPEDLDETQRELADCIGMEAYRRLIATFAGETIKVRMPKGLTRPLRNEKIRNDYNGYNIRELSRKYNLHENTIRDIISDIKEKKRNQPLPDQLSFPENDA